MVSGMVVDANPYVERIGDENFGGTIFNKTVPGFNVGNGIYH